MNYELAKKLKDAGFPLRDTYGSDLDMFADELSITIDGTTYMKPTLSELIEACGDRFHALERKQFEKIIVWVSYSNETNDLGIEAHIFKNGDTPEKAVANLWLELNKHA